MDLVLQSDSRLLGLTFNRCSKLLGLVLQSGPLKLGSVEFNIIINIKNFIIYVINIIIFIIINIINIEKKTIDLIWRVKFKIIIIIIIIINKFEIKYY